MYHGTRVWARRHTPELMLGVYSEEEFDEPKKSVRKYDLQTGEITESAGAEPTTPSDAADAPPTSASSPPEVGGALLLEQMAQEAAKRGPDVFNEFYKNRTIQERAIIAKIGKELRRLMDEAPAPELGE